MRSAVQLMGANALGSRAHAALADTIEGGSSARDHGSDDAQRLPTVYGMIDAHLIEL